jgi:hypothetical protein
MDGWWLVHCSGENLVLHLAKRRNNFQFSHTKPQIHLTVDYISVLHRTQLAVLQLMNDEVKVTILQEFLG